MFTILTSAGIELSGDLRLECQLRAIPSTSNQSLKCLQISRHRIELRAERCRFPRTQSRFNSTMASPTFTSSSGDPLRIRPANFADLPAMAVSAMTAYDGTQLGKFLSPSRQLFPADCLRMYYQRICLRWLNPRNLSFVACPASNRNQMNVVAGYTQVERLGDDEGAKRQIASRRTVWLTLLRWYCISKFQVVKYFWPNRSTDFDAVRKLEAWGQADDEIHWKPFPERANRWYVQSMVVSPGWQRKGVGKRLVAEILDRASRDGVVVGLEASADGEKLYRAVGFEFLGTFTGDPSKIGEEGGVMIWRPEKAKAE